MIKALKIMTPDGKPVYTEFDNRLSMIEYCRMFDVKMEEVVLPDSAIDHVLLLSEVVDVLNDSSQYNPPKIKEESAYQSNTTTKDTDRETARQKALRLRSGIKSHLLSGNGLRVNDIMNWGYGLSKGAISRHFTIVRNELALQGYTITKQGSRWFLRETNDNA